VYYTYVRLAIVINTRSCCMCVIGGCIVGYIVTSTTMPKLFRSKVIGGWWGAGNLEGWRGRSRVHFSAWYFDIRLYGRNRWR